MDLNFLLRGLAIGFSIATPVGPVGVLCILRTLAEGRVSGLFSGLGAATADAIYGCVAGFGVTFISSILINQQILFRLTGGLFLCYLGVKTFLARPSEQSASTTRHFGLAGAYASTFFLTLTNPMTILSFAAIFAVLGLVSTGGNFVSAALLVLGIFFGSASWWFLLSGGISLFRSRFSLNWLHWVSRVSGIIILGFGLIVLVSLVG